MVPPGRRKRGRPNQRWMDCVNRDTRAIGTTKDEVHDRTKWEQLEEEKKNIFCMLVVSRLPVLCLLSPQSLLSPVILDSVHPPLLRSSVSSLPLQFYHHLLPTYPVFLFSSHVRSLHHFNILSSTLWIFLT